MKRILELRTRHALAVTVLATATTLLVPAARAQESAAAKGSAAFEQRFLEMMTHHHRGGVEMANLCQSKAQHQELKPFCSQLAGSQQKEADQMQGWLTAWYQGKGGMPKAEMDKMMAQHKQHMTKLNAATGEQFDHTFLQLMTMHHQQAVPEAKTCSARASHQELKALCMKMSGEQQKEIGQMQAWMKQWGNHAGHKSK